MAHVIVLAADLSVYTPYIVQQVLTLANSLQARIVVVHAVEPLGSLGNALVETYLPAEDSQALAAEGMDVLLATIKERLVGMLADEFVDQNLALGQVLDVAVESGRPADVILKHARRTNADMIVMGSHGPHLDYGRTLGSATSKVLQLSRVPVHVVPMPERRPGYQVKTTATR